MKNIIIKNSDFPKFRKKIMKKYKIANDEYEEMVEYVGTWEVDKKTGFKSIVLVSSHGTPKLIVISEQFFREILK